MDVHMQQVRLNEHSVALVRGNVCYVNVDCSTACNLHSCGVKFVKI